MKNSPVYYSVGALLYCPANNESIVNSIVNERFGSKYSLALCLEDTIKDDCLSQAEVSLVRSLINIHKARCSAEFYLPKIFLRVRSANQIPDLLNRLGGASEIVSGFILPKFSQENSDEFIRAVTSANEGSEHTFYMMPILESPSIINLKSRYDILYSLKEKLDSVEKLVLNIRVGGNDLCHYFGFRRHSDESIHGILPVSNIFSDIITVFGADYVVSGPVWEYYSGAAWASGLERELREDRLCGFIGKTVIHPNQIELVNAAYKVEQKDYDDALSILNWDSDAPCLVSGSAFAERMNEYKTHSKWALKTIMLAKAYGIK